MGVALFNQGNEFDGFGMRFYAPTAFHGVHVIVGVLWGLFVMYNARKGNYSSKNHAGVEIFGLYWHFVDVVWIILFTMLYLI
jgi:heme/copper-type cytochrome/quinol oxidase subunit 3